MKEDLIDFPCSPTWASYYAERGLTQDYPPEFYQRSRQPDDKLMGKYVAALEEAATLRELLAQARYRAESLERDLAQAHKQLDNRARIEVQREQSPSGATKIVPLSRVRGVEL